MPKRARSVNPFIPCLDTAASSEDHAALEDNSLTRKAAKRSYPPGQHGRPSKALWSRSASKRSRSFASTTASPSVGSCFLKRGQEGSTGTTCSSCSRTVSTMSVRLGFGLVPVPATGEPWPRDRERPRHRHRQLQCKPGDVVAIRERKCSKQLAEANLGPVWPTCQPTGTGQGQAERQLTGRCERESVAQINELLVVEYSEGLSLVHRGLEHFSPLAQITATPATVFKQSAGVLLQVVGQLGMGVVLSYSDNPRTSTDMNWTIAQTTKYIGHPNQEELRRQFLTPLRRTGESMTSTRIGIQCCVFRANGDC